MITAEQVRALQEANRKELLDSIIKRIEALIETTAAETCENDVSFWFKGSNEFQFKTQIIGHLNLHGFDVLEVDPGDGSKGLSISWES